MPLTEELTKEVQQAVNPIPRKRMEKSNENVIPKFSKERRPLIPVVLAVAIGIILDEFMRLPFTNWLSVSIIFFLLWLFLEFGCSRKHSLILLLISISSLGAAYHHWDQFVISKNNIYSFASKDWKLVRLKGIINSPTTTKLVKSNSFHSTSNFQQFKTTIEVEALSLKDNKGWIKTSGTTRVHIKGDVSTLLPGDLIEVSGWISRIKKPQNPGEFNYQKWMRRKSIRTLLFAEHPLAVRSQKSTKHFLFQRITTKWRDYCKDQLKKHLTPENQSIANALFLGDRSRLSMETREMLAESGMFHLISISGLHIGFLAVLIHFSCRLIRFTPFKTAFTVISLLILYAIFTGARPPVVRATLVISCSFYAIAWNRRLRIYNILAFSMLILIIFNPSVIFDTGAQLSYLAIFGLVEGANYFHRWKRYKSKNRLDEMVHNRSIAHRFWNMITSRFLQSSVMMAGIFLFNFPLIESQFHLISLSGFATNLLLIPIAGLCICAGYLILFLILIVPSLAGTPAYMMNEFLTFFLEKIRLVTEISSGHFYTPGFPFWWISIFYAVLFLMIFSQTQKKLFKKALPILLVSWSCLGLALIFQTGGQKNLRGTFLSVGHGTSVLLEFPNGKTVLYDAGSLNGGKRAASIIESVLWKHGHSRLDAIVISHADIDHCNAVPHLMDRIPIGSIVTTPTFLDFNQSIVQLICTKAHELKTPILLATVNDQILIDNNVTVKLIHPLTNRKYDTDNENSIVLLIEYKGKRILLPGDIEGVALTDLIKRTEGNFDLFMTPHHGSLSANDPKTIQWASPSIAITSGANKRVNEQLKLRYPNETQIYSTNRDGAVSFTITSKGILKMDTNNK